ncbi:DegT/DnrJ/EryC1/StrS family aminotransferase [Coraliomargarita akajimensis]|uniref:Glutamine--scyllo-inositol transaminase n=1 Tax=Coraliomargarita akajimensis (strain DSM 45221 / IAM 15411 / JCM 23193 / KCTC 12865 / 04OKA010-24) TaxID=583355 RepID=D5EJT2_CORAD|nr:aminotransferase class I/II-fold pyridoxal phosphate-dependent enzyme [Coraliomargarita akajimensis]ADE54681.1 Glutamine--scyllo-inositol transaminase [Coraliomargarita akajimensis DSM 45221]
MPRIYLSPPDIRPEDHQAVDAVLSSNWVAPVGPHLAAFEQAVCERMGRSHAVALNSGTAALHMALQVLEIGPGDAVICPSLTFAASANPICYCGAEPVFVDSEPRSWNLDPTLLEQALKERDDIRAVIVVHLYGQCAEMDPIVELCRQYGVSLIEDAAEALGASYKGRPAGSFGDLSFVSFNGNKIITTSGGGMLLADKAEWIQQALYLSTQAREPVLHYEHTAVGFNYRMSNVLAGLGSAQLKDLDRRVAVRRAHYDAYAEAFADIDELSMMPLRDADACNYWLSCLTVESGPQQVLDALAAAEIEARPLWKPLHLQPVFEGCVLYGGAVAEDLFARGVCLPSGSSLTEAERGEVIRIVRSCFR